MTLAFQSTPQSTVPADFFDCDINIFHKPIVDNILSNFNPKKVLKSLNEEDKEQLQKIALVCRHWSKSVSSWDCSYFDYLDKPILNVIFFYCSNKKPGALGRVNDIGIYEKIGSISKSCRAWVLSPDGPFRLLGKDIHSLLPETPTTLRRSMGTLNQEVMRRSNKWFEYIDLVRKGEEGQKIEYPKGISSNVRNFEGKSPLSQAIPLLLQDQNKYGFILEELCAAGISDCNLAQALNTVFTYERTTQYENRFSIANTLISKIKEIKGNEELITQTLEPISWKILTMNPQDIKESYLWLEKIGCEYTAPALAGLLGSASSDVIYLEESWPYLKAIFNDRKISFDTPVSCKDHLIHHLLKNGSLNHELRAEFVRSILKKYPHEVNVNDTQGRNLLSLLFIYNYNDILESLKDCIDESALWSLREGCHTTLITNVRFDRLNYLTLYPEKIPAFLKELKKMFPSGEAFEKWLHNSPEDNFLHEIAYWSPLTIRNLLMMNDLSEEVCQKRNLDGDTVLDICERQENLFAGLSDKTNQIPIDRQSYDRFNEKFIKHEKSPYIFKLLDNGIVTPKFEQLLQLDCNVTDIYGNTLLGIFLRRASEGHNEKEYIAYLIDMGVDPNLKNKDGKSSVDIAKGLNLLEVLELLC